MRLNFGPFLVALTITMLAACSPADSGIATKVKANLTADENVRAAKIDVGVQKSVVTLSGTVDTTGIKDRAVSLARGTEGVTDIVDQIAVRQSPGPGYGREMSANATMGHETTGDDGTMGHGTPSNGTMNNGTPNNGTPNNGTTNNGTTNNGTMRHGMMGPGMMGNEAQPRHQ